MIRMFSGLSNEPESGQTLDSFGTTHSYLDLLHLFFISDVHLLQGVLQLPVSLQQSLPQLCRQLLRLVPTHLAVLVEVALVANEDVNHVVRQDVLTHLLVPLPHMVKGLAVGEIKD